MKKAFILINIFIFAAILSGCMLMNNLNNDIASSITGGVLYLYSDTTKPFYYNGNQVVLALSNNWVSTEVPNVGIGDGNNMSISTSGYFGFVEYRATSTNYMVDLSRFSNGHLVFSIKTSVVPTNAYIGIGYQSGAQVKYVYLNLSNTYIAPVVFTLGTNNVKIPIADFLKADSGLDLTHMMVFFNIQAQTGALSINYDNVFWSEK